MHGLYTQTLFIISIWIYVYVILSWKIRLTSRFSRLLGSLMSLENDLPKPPGPSATFWEKIIHQKTSEEFPPPFFGSFFAPWTKATEVCLCWDSVLVLFALGHFCVGLLIFFSVLRAPRRINKWSSGKQILMWFMEKEIDLNHGLAILYFEVLISISLENRRSGFTLASFGGVGAVGARSVLIFSSCQTTQHEPQSKCVFQEGVQDTEIS